MKEKQLGDLIMVFCGGVAVLVTIFWALADHRNWWSFGLILVGVLATVFDVARIMLDENFSNDPEKDTRTVGLMGGILVCAGCGLFIANHGYWLLGVVGGVGACLVFMVVFDHWANLVYEARQWRKRG